MSQTALTDFFMTPEQYDESAAEYAANETLEDIMESSPQARQRTSFLGLVMLRQDHPDLGVLNEKLVQYPHNGRLRRVVSGNMLVMNDGTDPRTDQRRSYNLEYEPGQIFMTAEYVSEHDSEKDLPGGSSYNKYEDELQVPYYLLYDEDNQAMPLRLFHHDGKRYQQLRASSNGRFPIKELHLEVGVIDKLIRYWHHGELLPVYEEIPNILAEKNHLIADQKDQLIDQKQQLTDRNNQLARLAELAASGDLEEIRRITAQFADE